MAITNLPTFTDDEILTAAKLNSMVSTLESKFTAIAGGDIAWPLVAQGNLDMNSYEIIRLPLFWNIVNMAEYSGDYQAAINAAGTGGCVVIPPGEVIEVEGLSIDVNDITIMGFGQSSELKLPAGATSDLLATNTSGVSNITIQNLYFNGRTQVGSSLAAINIQKGTRVRVMDCWFNQFSGNGIEVTNDGSDGNPSTDIFIHDCIITNCGDDGIWVDDVEGLNITNCRIAGVTDGIDCTAASASAKMRSINISGNRLSTISAKGIYVAGGAGSSSLYRLVRIFGNLLLSPTGDGITCGIAGGVIRYGNVQGNQIISPGADAFVCCMAEGGIIANNLAVSATGDGLDASSTDETLIVSNNFADAGAKGIDATSSTDTRIMYNDVHGATTEAIDRASTTALVAQHNYIGAGVASSRVEPGTWYWKVSSNTGTGAGSGTFSDTITIPANTVKVGDVIEIIVGAYHTGTGADATINLDFGGVNGSTKILDASEHQIMHVWLKCTALSGAGALEGILWAFTEETTIPLDEQPWEINVDEHQGSSITLTSDLTVSVDWALGDVANTVGLSQFGMCIHPGTEST